MKTEQITRAEQIPFSLEMVKKIQAGEVKGSIKTRDGMAARFICEIRNNEYPLLFICGNEQREWAYHYTINGFYFFKEYEDHRDIILEIEDEQKKPEHQFKPFDKVLVRENSEDYWHPDFFAMWHGEFAECVNHNDIKYIIPYEGNESLLGTTYKPKGE